MPKILHIVKNMKQLEKEIRKNGFLYKQIKASIYAYIYEQISDGKTVGYEVFQHREGKEYEIGGNIIPASVQFPGNEAFGGWAWTYKTLEKAESKFKDLEEKEMMAIYE